MISLGGQMALCYMDESWFIDTPLMFISTWDGDAYSLAQFATIARRTIAEPQSHEALIARFHQHLVSKLVQNGVSNYDLLRGSGWFAGPVELSLAQLFRSAGAGRRVCLPSPGAMRQFVDSGC